MSLEIWVHKLDENGQEVWKYPAEIIEQTELYIRLRASFDRDDISVGQLRLRLNDTFIETFFFDRWYNVFEVFAAQDKHFKGWYCNIARPATMEGQHLYAEDLALDLVVLPDGSQEILDQDEFEQLEIPEAHRMKALQTLQSLQKQASNRSGIFAGPRHI
jgi:protein associated with RNAse G/E